MTLKTEHTLNGYEEASTGAVIYGVPDPGHLRIGGADRAVYIQRQTTNDVGLLAPDRSLLTVLTSGTARILDVWRLVMEPGSDEIGVITLSGRGAATARYLQSRIFFKDQVTVTDASAEFAQFEVFGPAAGTILGNQPAPDSVIAAEIGGVAVRVFGLRDDAYGLMAPVGQGETLAARLIKAGAVLLNAEAYEVLRVESGRPGPAQELTGEHTPLEANLDGAISSTKGCYSGQEVIARQLTYDKVARRLVGLRLEQTVAVGAAVQVDGRTAGRITSAVQSPRFGPIALAVIRRPHFEPRTYVTVVTDDTRAVPGETVSLPFGT